MNAPPAPLNLWTERYESLRRHFVENRLLLAADPIGLTCLLRNGIAGWMRSWMSDAAALLQSPAASPQSWKPPAAPVRQQELTRLIAQMTGQHLQPAQRL